MSNEADSAAMQSRRKFSDNFTSIPLPGHFYVILTALGWRELRQKHEEERASSQSAFYTHIPIGGGLMVDPVDSFSIIHLRFASLEDARDALTCLRLFGISRAIVEKIIPKFNDGLGLAELNPEWIDAPFILTSAMSSEASCQPARNGHNAIRGSTAEQNAV